MPKMMIDRLRFVVYDEFGESEPTFVDLIREKEEEQTFGFNCEKDYNIGDNSKVIFSKHFIITFNAFNTSSIFYIIKQPWGSFENSRVLPYDFQNNFITDVVLDDSTDMLIVRIIDQEISHNGKLLFFSYSKANETFSFMQNKTYEFEPPNNIYDQEQILEVSPNAKFIAIGTSSLANYNEPGFRIIELGEDEKYYDKQVVFASVDKIIFTSDNRLFFNERNDENNTFGSIHEYELIDGRWSEKDVIAPFIPIASNFGVDFDYYVDMDTNENKLVVGNPGGANGNGLIRVFTDKNGYWEETQKIFPELNENNPKIFNFGANIQLTNYGSRLFVGIPGYYVVENATMQGCVMVYDYKNSEFILTDIVYNQYTYYYGKLGYQFGKIFSSDPSGEYLSVLWDRYGQKDLSIYNINDDRLPPPIQLYSVT